MEMTAKVKQRTIISGVGCGKRRGGELKLDQFLLSPFSQLPIAIEVRSIDTLPLLQKKKPSRQCRNCRRFRSLQFRHFFPPPHPRFPHFFLPLFFLAFSHARIWELVGVPGQTKKGSLLTSFFQGLPAATTKEKKQYTNSRIPLRKFLEFFRVFLYGGREREQDILSKNTYL